jgi:hypothetical protein
MQQSIVVPMKINHQLGDEVPVVLENGVVVGRVTHVRAVYILDGIEHTEVQVEVRDDAAVIAMKAYAEIPRPRLHMFFPRVPE